MNQSPFIFGITVHICSFLFFLLLFYISFHKNAKYTIKNHLFRRVLYMGIFGFFFEFVYLFFIRFTKLTMLISFAYKTVLLCFIACLLLWTYYVFLLLYEKDPKINSQIRRERTSIDIYLLITFAVISIIELCLPSTFHYAKEHITFLGGHSIIFANIVVSLLTLLPLPFLLMNRKKIVPKKFYPYFLISFIIFFTLICGGVFPEYSFIGFSFVMSCYIVYDRLENPDILLIRKLIRSHDEYRSFRNRYGFLFNMSPELRELLNEISYMKDNYLIDEKRPISKRKLEALILDFVKSGESGRTTQTILDNQGVEILGLEDVDDELMVTREIYSLDELKAILEEDNAPKW